MHDQPVVCLNGVELDFELLDNTTTTKNFCNKHRIVFFTCCVSVVACLTFKTSVAKNRYISLPKLFMRIFVQMG